MIESVSQDLLLFPPPKAQSHTGTILQNIKKMEISNCHIVAFLKGHRLSQFTCTHPQPSSSPQIPYSLQEEWFLSIVDCPLYQFLKFIDCPRSPTRTINPSPHHKLCKMAEKRDIICASDRERKKKQILEKWTKAMCAMCERAAAAEAKWDRTTARALSSPQQSTMIIPSHMLPPLRCSWSPPDHRKPWRYCRAHRHRQFPHNCQDLQWYCYVCRCCSKPQQYCHALQRHSEQQLYCRAQRCRSKRCQQFTPDCHKPW